MEKEPTYGRKPYSKLMPKDYERMSPANYSKVLEHHKSKAKSDAIKNKVGMEIKRSHVLSGKSSESRRKLKTHQILDKLK